MDYSKLAKRARKIVDERGGTKSVVDDLKELKDIAAKDEGLKEKAKDAAAALKDPGAPGEPRSTG
jgi:hypothetical protein